MTFLRIGSGLFRLKDIGAVTPRFDAITNSWDVLVTAQGHRHRVTSKRLTEQNAKNMVNRAVDKITKALKVASA